MARCRNCGVELAYSRQAHCVKCKKEWSEKRTQAFNQAVEEIGSLNKNNLKAIQDRVRILEKSNQAMHADKGDLRVDRRWSGGEIWIK